jgi:hypothetical protein
MPSADKQHNKHYESQKKAAENLLANEFHARRFMKRFHES